MNTIRDEHNIAPLVVAVIGQAVWEVENNDDAAARAWLKLEGIAWLDACGLDPDFIYKWLQGRRKRKTRRDGHIKTRTGSPRTNATRERHTEIPPAVAA